VCVKSGIMAAGLAGASPILAFLWKPGRGHHLALPDPPHQVLSAWNLGTGFAAGNFVFDFFMARAFTVQDTGGGAVTLTTNNAKLRTSMPPRRPPSRSRRPATLTAGTRTKDANPFRTLAGVVANAAFSPMLPETEVFRQQPGEWPIVLADRRGLRDRGHRPGHRHLDLRRDIDWDEVSSFGPLTLA
jgi:hypothetical protein